MEDPEANQPQAPQRHEVKRKRARKLLPPSPREGDREAVVGVAKVGKAHQHFMNVEGTSFDSKNFIELGFFFATPPVSFADSSLGEGA